MTVDDMQAHLNAEVADGLLLENQGTILSTAEGYNHAACAATGALVLNLGNPGFNMYCENQRRMLGWLTSKANPLSRRARELRSRHRSGDPSVSSMFEDVRREFLEPLSLAHRRAGGAGLTPKQDEATCAMLLAKILWDVGLGNPEMGGSIRMLRTAVGE